MRFHGVNHLALVSSNMDRTVRFYTQVLGLKLVRAQRNDDDPNSRHYFFDLGGGNLLAFFDFPGSRRGQVGTGTMHHGHRLGQSPPHRGKPLGEHPENC
ncbi:MAG: VOC family protein [Deltaproteobacteria bacterium]|nr:VOC family protein [Deltaproteobacteria bacterium]